MMNDAYMDLFLIGAVILIEIDCESPRIEVDFGAQLCKRVLSNARNEDCERLGLKLFL